MIAGPCADARTAPALNGDGRHEGLGSVAAGHTDAVGATIDGIAGQLSQVQSLLKQHYFDAHLFGNIDQSEFLDLAAAGLRIADQDGVLGLHVSRA